MARWGAGKTVAAGGMGATADISLTMSGADKTGLGERRRVCGGLLSRVALCQVVVVKISHKM
jgi:hypothetical protein